jgi:hypothetical protein
MPVMFKNGKSANVAGDQIEAMESAGWSKDKPSDHSKSAAKADKEAAKKAKAAKEAEEAAQADDPNFGAEGIVTGD